jgi:hypothetical protein
MRKPQSFQSLILLGLSRKVGFCPDWGKQNPQVLLSFTVKLIMGRRWPKIISNTELWEATESSLQYYNLEFENGEGSVIL